MPPKSRKRLSASDKELNNSPNTKRKKVQEKSPQKNVSGNFDGKKKDLSVKDINEMEISQLLALGENFSLEKNKDLISSDSEDSEDFEEVKNSKLNNPEIPKEGVSIVLEIPHRKQKKKLGIDPEAHIRRQINKVKKGIQLLMHKVHVLCWIAHIKFINNALNSQFIMKSCIKLVKSKNLYPPKYSDISYLEGILKWFHKTFELQTNQADHECSSDLLQELGNQIKNKKAFSYRNFILIFIAVLRVLGLKARVVMSFQVLPIKPPQAELMENGNDKDTPNCSQSNEDKANLAKKKTKKEEGYIEIDKNNSKEAKSFIKKEPTKAIIPENGSFVEANSKSPVCNSVKKKMGRNSVKKNGLNLTENTLNKKQKGKIVNEFKKNAKKRDTLSENSKNNEKYDDGGNGQDRDDDDSDDDNFKKESLQRKKKKVLNKNITSSNDESLPTKKKEGCDVWAEVFVEAEEKWISVDVPKNKVHCISELYSRATHPVLYVIAGNVDSTLKDVTKRYVPHWHSDTKKKRVDENWWNETMKPYLPPRSAFEQEEDNDIAQQLHDQPLPSIISEYKDHPLYALKRHLLKFEAIYPPDAPTLGFIRGEAVYARECVHTLHSREMWYKQARVVRLKEEPYKIVKARPKYDKMTGDIKKDLPLELFGKWQTEDYIPPIACDGKVPRNEYGNVDLFQPCMLPLGTVHLQIPALNKIARKLGIDCAPATVGFDFHSGGSHPVFDGFVVCEEFKETLLDAWNKEIDESAKKSEEKREKRIYSAWKRLIRGLLIREKLQLKYSFGRKSPNGDDSQVAP